MPAPEPKIKRSYTLALRGDAGGGALHRIAGWLSREMAKRSGPYTRIGIWNGRGHVDNVRAVGRGEVDIALVTPASFARMAVGGGPYTKEPYPDLLALGTVPVADRLLFAVSAGTGVRTFKDLREDRPPLRIATAPNDGVHHVGMGVANVLERSGVPRAAIEGWGSRFIEFDDSRGATEAVLNGEADAAFAAGVADEGWSKLTSERAMNFLPIEPEVGEAFEKVGWPRAKVAKGALRGVSEEIVAMDFSDVLLVCRKDLPEDVAYLVAWCLAETGDGAKLDARQVAATALPLHPWARAFYESVGAVAKASR